MNNHAVKLDSIDQLLASARLPEQFELAGFRYELAGSSAESMATMLVEEVGSHEPWILWSCYDPALMGKLEQMVCLVFATDGRSIYPLRVQYGRL